MKRDSFNKAKQYDLMLFFSKYIHLLSPDDHVSLKDVCVQR